MSFFFLVMESLWRVINSNLDYKISSGLQISFLVLSPSHTKNLLQKKSAKKMNEKKFTETEDRFGFSAKVLGQKKSLFQINSTYLELNSPFFNKSCLVVAFTVAYFFNKSSENKNNKDFQLFKKLHKKDERDRKKGLNFILRKCSELLSEVNVPLKGPHSLEHLQELCDHYNVQVWGFSSLIRDRNYVQYPKNFDPTRIPIFLYFSEGDFGLVHVDTILNLSKFFTRPKPCIQCLSFRSHIRFHRCKMKTRLYCKQCNRIALQEQDYHNQALEQIYCLSKVIQSGNKICDFCNKSFDNLECLHYHKSLCKMFENCSKCGKRSRKNGHQCNTKRCLLCFENYSANSEDHLCNIQTPNPSKIFPRLAFFDCETRIEQRSDYANLIPNIVVTLFESAYHEEFSLITFCEGGLNLDIDGQIIPEALKVSYLPSYYNRRIMNQKVSPFFKGRNFEKEGPSLQISNENANLWTYHLPFRKDLASDCMYKFLRFFLRSYFRNTVFISHRGSRFDSLPLIGILLKFPTLKINVIHAGNAALCLEIKSLNIRFIDFYRYCPSSLDSLCSQFDLKIKKSFFPYKFIIKDHHNYIGKIPDYDEYWFQSFDALKKMKEKKEFWMQEAQKSRLWNFNLELYEYCKLDVFCLAEIGMTFFFLPPPLLFLHYFFEPFFLTACSFTKQSFELQDRLLSKETSFVGHVHHFHPFFPAFTLPGYM